MKNVLVSTAEVYYNSQLSETQGGAVAPSPAPPLNTALHTHPRHGAQNWPSPSYAVVLIPLNTACYVCSVVIVVADDTG